MQEYVHMNCQRHALATLRAENVHWYLLNMRSGGPQNQSERHAERKIVALNGT
jgi:hypothetical protein